MRGGREQGMNDSDKELARRNIRTALLLGLVALGFLVAFIIVVVHK
jgi:hypothetical protein